MNGEAPRERNIMFSIFMNNAGPVGPTYYVPAAAGDYEVGTVLTVNTSGSAAAPSAALTTTPTYLCLRTGTVAAGERIPVLLITKELELETELTAKAETAKEGSSLEVSAGGTGVDLTAAGTFCLTYLEDTALGSKVRGRFK